MLGELKPFQNEIEPDTLYAVAYDPNSARRWSDMSDSQLAPTIQIVGAICDVYVSQALPDSAPTGMTKLADDSDGFTKLDYVPNYLYVEPDDAAPDHIILSGVSAVEVAA